MEINNRTGMISINPNNTVFDYEVSDSTTITVCFIILGLIVKLLRNDQLTYEDSLFPLSFGYFLPSYLNVLVPYFSEKKKITYLSVSPQQKKLHTG